MDKLVTAALQKAASQDGVRETSNNAGPKVNEFLHSTGLGSGFPWCAAFVYWCIEHAAQDFKVANPFIRTASCSVIDSWAQDQDISFNTPQPGDVFLRRGTVEGVFRACHTGFVEQVNGVTFTTWEGNTNTDGSREGIGVFHRTRTNSDRFCFVRWATSSLTMKRLHLPISSSSVPTKSLCVTCPFRGDAPSAPFVSGESDLDLRWTGMKRSRCSSLMARRSSRM